MTSAAVSGRVSCLEQHVRKLFSPSCRPTSHGSPGSVGLEIELIPVEIASGSVLPVPASRTKTCLEGDPALIEDAGISFEPGGQLEMSPPPQPSASGALCQARALTSRIRSACQSQGIDLVSCGVNPWHSTEDLGLQTDKPRYRRMQAHFDAIGPSGRRMMRLTAALQVCLDAGEGAAARERWLVANLAGPALTAAFSNSPILEGRVTGNRCGRSLLWQETDPSRTGFDGRQAVEEPERPYADLALQAEAIPLPRDGSAETLPFRQPFDQWLDGDGARPDEDDVEHHLSTLFPPVRPRSYLEVRYLDALPEQWLDVPVSLLATLLYEPHACRRALDVLEGHAGDLSERWRSAAVCGTGDSEVAAQACALFEICLSSMGRLPAGYLPEGARGLVETYAERYPGQGRSPADDQLDHFTTNPEEFAAWLSQSNQT